ncbi:MAG: type II secretion system protein [Elusimicrobiaceae bacterium]|nr:type II secretion system protein [Elusimicrobiaceae bacterium]
MKKQGFTLIELLIVVLIIGILCAAALPGYLQAIEKSRATEAINLIKSVNDGVYAYASEKNECPAKFSKLLITVPGTVKTDTQIETKDFIYHLNEATNALIPGTACGGVVAERKGGTYKLWNPYKVIDTTTKKRTMACTASADKGIKACKALGIYTTQSPKN